jgi:hypothetical protein
MSSYCFALLLVLTSCPRPATAQYDTIYVSSCYYICVLGPLYIRVLVILYICPLTTIYESSYYYVCVSSYCYMSTHTALLLYYRSCSSKSERRLWTPLRSAGMLQYMCSCLSRYPAIYGFAYHYIQTCSKAV